MAKPHNDLTADYVRSILDYMPETGELVWRVARGRARIGDVAGTMIDGYLRVAVDGKRYCAHRLVWLIYHDRWPVDQLDHINGARADNRIENLRESTQAENMQNRASSINSTSQYIGVSWHTRRKRWRADIKVNGKQKTLGYYDTGEEAAAAYAKAKAELHTFSPKVRLIACGET